MSAPRVTSHHALKALRAILPAHHHLVQHLFDMQTPIQSKHLHQTAVVAEVVRLCASSLASLALTISLRPTDQLSWPEAPRRFPHLRAICMPISLSHLKLFAEHLPRTVTSLDIPNFSPEGWDILNAAQVTWLESFSFLLLSSASASATPALTAFLLRSPGLLKLTHKAFNSWRSEVLSALDWEVFECCCHHNKPCIEGPIKLSPRSFHNLPPGVSLEWALRKLNELLDPSMVLWITGSGSELHRSVVGLLHFRGINIQMGSSKSLENVSACLGDLIEAGRHETLEDITLLLSQPIPPASPLIPFVLSCSKQQLRTMEINITTFKQFPSLFPKLSLRTLSIKMSSNIRSLPEVTPDTFPKVSALRIHCTFDNSDCIQLLCIWLKLWNPPPSLHIEAQFLIQKVKQPQSEPCHWKQYKDTYYWKNKLLDQYTQQYLPEWHITQHLSELYY